MAVNKVPAAEINFGDLGFYVAGSGIPEGLYANEYNVCYEPETENYKPKVKRLGVMLSAHPLDGGDVKTKFLSMGGSAHESFAPDPDTGKSLALVAGGKGAITLNQSSNWAIHLKSLYDCGLPQGIFTNDVSVLDGVHVRIVNKPEPSDRAGFKSKTASTAEVKEEEKARTPGTIPVVSEIIEGGMPWEGGGGIPAAKEEKPAPKAAVGKVAPKPAAKPNGAAATKAKPSGISEEDLHDAALAGVTSVLENNPDGCAKLMLQTGTFKAVTKSVDEATASAVIDGFFKDTDTLNGLLAELGYELNKSNKVVPVAG